MTVKENLVRIEVLEDLVNRLIAQTLEGTPFELPNAPRTNFVKKYKKVKR